MRLVWSLLFLLLLPLVSAEFIFQNNATSIYNDGAADFGLFFDNNYATFAYDSAPAGAPLKYAYWNYTINSSSYSVGSMLQYKSICNTSNITIPAACWNTTALQFRVVMDYDTGPNPDEGSTKLQCYDNTGGWNTQFYRCDWNINGQSDWGSRAYEQDMWWYVPDVDDICIDDIAAPSVTFFLTVAIAFMIFSSLITRPGHNGFKIMLTVGLLTMLGLVVWLLQNLSSIC